MHISIIRHGEMAGEPFVRPDRPVSGCLSELGVSQAESVHKALRDSHYDLVFCSPYGRALQTAEILFADRNIPIKVLPFLHEWLPNPEGQHAKATAIPEQDQFYAEDRWKTDAGEGTLEFAARVGPPFLKALKEVGIHRRHGGYVPDPGAEDLRIAVVAHGGTNNVLLTFLLDLPPTPMGRFAFDLVGVARLEFQLMGDVYYPCLMIPRPA